MKSGLDLGLQAALVSLCSLCSSASASDCGTQADGSAYLREPLAALAASNPDVELVVRKLPRGRAAVIRGHYVNGRDKVICVNGLQSAQVAGKVALLLESSGAKLRSLKNDTLEAGPGNESARGVWSALHAQSKDGGYRI